MRWICTLAVIASFACASEEQTSSWKGDGVCTTHDPGQDPDAATIPAQLEPCLPWEPSSVQGQTGTGMEFNDTWVILHPEIAWFEQDQVLKARLCKGLDDTFVNDALDVVITVQGDHRDKIVFDGPMSGPAQNCTGWETLALDLTEWKEGEQFLADTHIVSPEIKAVEWDGRCRPAQPNSKSGGGFCWRTTLPPMTRTSCPVDAR